MTYDTLRPTLIEPIQRIDGCMLKSMQTLETALSESNTGKMTTRDVNTDMLTINNNDVTIEAVTNTSLVALTGLLAASTAMTLSDEEVDDKKVQ